MSSPTNMKTGITLGSDCENMLPEIFFIIYLILGAILRRCGFKDCHVFLEHNHLVFNREYFDTGIVFNLFSEYGVGKSLEPLIYQLFSNLMIDTDKNNIFVQEIQKLTGEASRIYRSHDVDIEANWIMTYSINSLNLLDGIAINRETRLFPLFYPFNNGNEEECKCGFCTEFRKYHYPDDRNVNQIINNVLGEIVKAC